MKTEYEIELEIEQRFTRVSDGMHRFHAWAEAPENREHMENVRAGDPLALARYRGFADEFQRRVHA